MTAHQFGQLKKKIEKNSCSICGKNFKESWNENVDIDFEEISYSQSKGGYYVFFHTKCLDGMCKK